ncbi:MAG: class I SAM-dependent methyltransferase [Pseudomonadota bacterium]
MNFRRTLLNYLNRSSAEEPETEKIAVLPEAQVRDYNTRARENQERFRREANLERARALESELMNASNLAGLFYPEDRSDGGYVVLQASAEALEKPLEQRIPPTALRHYYGVKNNRYYDDLYIKSGNDDITAMKKILAGDNFQLLGERILEFGCSAGRLLRHLVNEAEANEAWGVDLHSAAIHWAQSHLSPPFNFCLTTTTPHLPFEDNYFGFIFAGSVWTHIGELDDAWLLEMRRILRPDGRLYLTISDQHTLAEVARTQPDHPSNNHVAELDEATGMLSMDYIQFVTRTSPWLQRSVYNRAHWLAKIGRWMEVSCTKEGAYGWQTGVLLKKRTA